MRNRSSRRRSLVIAAMGLVIAFLSLLTATSILARPQWNAAGEPASGSDGASKNDASVSSGADREEARSQAPASSRGDRASEAAPQPSWPAPVQQGSSKAPGLALPLPSSLEAAAAAMAKSNASGRTIRVGIQAGHWKNSELPDELALLRGSTGAEGSGWKEVDVNVDVSRKVVALLGSFGVQADLLPSTVAAGYRADAFVAIHADANSNRGYSGFKIARAAWSGIPRQDDALVSALTGAYEAGTGLRWHAETITDNMTEYYAFNHQFKHSVSAATPAAIVELGFLTNPSDRKLMLTQSDRLAQSVALGVLSFLAK